MITKKKGSPIQTLIHYVSIIVAIIALSLPLSFAKSGNTQTKGVRTIYLVRDGQYNYDDERDPDTRKALVPAIPTPDEVIGFPLGEQPVRHEQAVRYFKILSGDGSPGPLSSRPLGTTNKMLGTNEAF